MDFSPQISGILHTRVVEVGQHGRRKRSKVREQQAAVVSYPGLGKEDTTIVEKNFART